MGLEAQGAIFLYDHEIMVHSDKVAHGVLYAHHTFSKLQTENRV